MTVTEIEAFITKLEDEMKVSDSFHESASYFDAIVALRQIWRLKNQATAIVMDGFPSRKTFKG